LSWFSQALFLVDSIFFSLQIELSIFIFWENITYCDKKYPISTALKLGYKEIFTKRKTGRAISYRDSRLLALCAKRRLVNKAPSSQVAPLSWCASSGPTTMTPHELMMEGIDSRRCFAAAASARMTNWALMFAVRIDLIVVGRPWISPIATVMITSDGEEDGSICVCVKTHHRQSPVMCGSGERPKSGRSGQWVD
jgi:hypothetical protein